MSRSGESLVAVGVSDEAAEADEVIFSRVFTLAGHGGLLSGPASQIG